MKIFVHSRRGLGGRVVRTLYAQDMAHDPAPYGFDAADKNGDVVAYSEDRPPGKLSGFLFGLTGFDVLHGFDNLAAIRKADVVWTLLEWEWLEVSLLQRLGLAPKVPIIGNSVWLAEEWLSWSARRHGLWRWLMTRHVYLTLHSQRTLERAKALLPDKTFHLTHFGVSTRAFPTTAPDVQAWEGRPIRVYSIGADRTRDWSTMLEAFGGDARFEVKIVATWAPDVDPARFGNLTLTRSATVTEQRAAYAWADFVIMPMVENSFSGITVMCEAASMGKPVVASRTGGADTYFDEDEVLYVTPQDPDALRRAVLDATPEEMRGKAQRAQARFLSSGYSADDMVDRYLALSKALLAA
jgi:glycosyltransferase involved in cell wall biosynthesis